MKPRSTNPTTRAQAADRAAEEVIGYLNFSTGREDPRFLSNLNELFAAAMRRKSLSSPPWRLLGQRLSRTLEQLRGSSEAFREVEQAEAAVRLVFDHLLPAYLSYHRDLLFHQSDAALFGPFFIGRACEAVLQEGPPWEETERVISGALARLNDYVGYRPVPVLRTEQEMQPYAHEFVRPVPIWVRGAGAAVGPYREMVEQAVAILEATDPAILRAAYFDPQQLRELAFDPRAYDFDHPASKRPNHLFGQWDLGRLDQSGRAWRFVVHQVVLDGLLERVKIARGRQRKERLFEAAAVLAGTMLMGSGVSGDRPGAHDSSLSLATLVQQIAAYRDAFYEQLFENLEGARARRLRAEAEKLKQPFGGARQHLNHFVAQRRADQFQRVRLAQLFARLGQTDAARRQVEKVAVASVRMECEIRCALTRAQRAVDGAQWEEALAALEEAEDLLHRAIECGAFVDPWNILGFGAQFSLFPSPENSLHDYRIDDLIVVVREIFGANVRLQQAATAAGERAVQEAAAGRLGALAAWWDRFASVEVSDVERLSGKETCASADHVVAALSAWHEAGTAAGDVAFWQQRAERFRSPKAYALVIQALLEQGDPVAAMALLIHWLSQSDRVPLAEAEHSFFDLAMAWMEQVWHTGRYAARSARRPVVPPQRRWGLARKFLDYLEANAEDYWQVPQFELSVQAAGGEEDFERPEEDEPDDLFQAAYEGVTYRDSADDGFEGSIFDSEVPATDFELTEEALRLYPRLGFLATLANLWRMAAVASFSQDTRDEERDLVLDGWLRQAGENYRRLLELLDAVHAYHIAPPQPTQQSMLEYDRRQMIKLTLLNHIITCCVETADAARMIRAAMDEPEVSESDQSWEELAANVLHAVLRQDVRGVQADWDALIDALLEQPLLYVPVEKGGNPRAVVSSRGIHRVLRRLLALLPRMGMICEAYWLLEIAQDMESDHPVGPGATTEFDELFGVGCRAIVRCLVHARGADDLSTSGNWMPGTPRAARRRLVDWVEAALEPLLHCWLSHSQGVRLSVLEAVGSPQQWFALRRFIERYGADLFTQKFMGFGNLRAILHQGVDIWLHRMVEEEDSEERPRLFDAIGNEISFDEAAHFLSAIIETVVENYGQYVDYNSTTTQSDRGEMLYTLMEFIRLQDSYNRVLWNLRPALLAHEVLVRCGRHEEAEMWTEAVSLTTGFSADRLLKKYDSLSRRYGMRLRSVAQHLEDRFVRPLEIDRLRALVRPALEELRRGETSGAFAKLESLAEQFTREVSGSGFELPAWLEALGEEIARVESSGTDDEGAAEPGLKIPQKRLTARQVERQLRYMLEDT